MLSSTLPAGAQIILTPTHQTILHNQTLKLDLDNDGVSEFSLKILNSHLDGGVTRRDRTKARAASPSWAQFPRIKRLKRPRSWAL